MTDQYQYQNLNLSPEEFIAIIKNLNVKDYNYSKRDDCDNGLGLFTAGGKNLQSFTCVVEESGNRYLVESYTDTESAIEGHERWLSFLKDQTADFPIMAYNWTEFDGDTVPVTVKVCPKSF